MAQRITHLGRIFHVTEEYEDIVDAVLSKGRSLSGADRWLFESADFEVSGNAILERHEILSPDGLPERLRLDNIALRHPLLSAEERQHYQELMRQAGFMDPTAIGYMDQLLRQDREYAFSWLEQMADALGELEPEDMLIHARELEEDARGPPSYGYHRADGVYEVPATDWFDRQPSLAQRLLTTPERCTNLAQLSRLGKGCYEASKATDTSHLVEYQQVYRSLSNAQQSVFWGNYQGRKRALTPRTRTSTAQSLSARIENAQGNDFRHLKGTLYKLQHGQLRLRDPPAEYEWSALWNQYRNRELRLADTREIPEGHSRCGYCYISNGNMYLPRLEELNPPKNHPATTQLHCLSCQYF